VLGVTVEAEYWGLLFEAAARARFELERDRCNWHDARTPDGRPVECKTCRVVLSNGRRGRWWIQRESHDRLVEAGGSYALSYYDPHAYCDGPIVDVVLVDAERVDELVSWTSNGRGHHRGEEHAKLGWPHLFERQGGEPA
jgi:hypothetical protein